MILSKTGESRVNGYLFVFERSLEPFLPPEVVRDAVKEIGSHVRERIAAAGAGLEALVFGPADLAASLGVPVLTIGAGTFDYALARISVAAHAFGLQAVDGPYAALDDEDGLLASSRRALAHGFDGKWVVHPRQIEPVRTVFTPSDEQVEQARRILAAADGAVLLDGAMVDLASKRLAERVLARSAG